MEGYRERIQTTFLHFIWKINKIYQWAVGKNHFYDIFQHFVPFWKFSKKSCFFMIFLIFVHYKALEDPQGLAEAHINFFLAVSELNGIDLNWKERKHHSFQWEKIGFGPGPTSARLKWSGEVEVGQGKWSFEVEVEQGTLWVFVGQNKWAGEFYFGKAEKIVGAWQGVRWGWDEAGSVIRWDGTNGQMRSGGVDVWYGRPSRQVRSIWARQDKWSGKPKMGKGKLSDEI